jgi:hypothetical protein
MNGKSKKVHLIYGILTTKCGKQLEDCFNTNNNILENENESAIRKTITKFSW